MIIKFDRSSVCMGDDVQSHEEEFDIDDDMLLSSLIKVEILQRLALIRGGKATWILRAKINDIRDKDIAVMAQQWEDAKLLINDCKVKELASRDGILEIFALYRNQEDPYLEYNKLMSKSD